MKYLVIILALSCFGVTASQADSNVAGWAVITPGYHPHTKHHQRLHKHRLDKGKYSYRSPANQEYSPIAAGIVAVPTAAGIVIHVAAGLADKFQGFVADLVANGYKPAQIHCYAGGGHVPNSRHYAGAACDIDQRGWGRTAAPMYHVAALAAKHGLRDGCSFRHADCGHIDDGRNVRYTGYRRRYG